MLRTAGASKSGLTPIGLCLAVWASLSGGHADASFVLEGVRNELASNVRAFVALDDEPCDAPRAKIRQLNLEADQQVRHALRPFGYYDPVITRSLRFDDSCWHAVISVVPGEPVLAADTHVRLIGDLASDPTFDVIKVRDYLVEGKPFLHASYENYKRALADLARARGYLDAAFTQHEVVVDRELRRADVALQFDGGVRYRHRKLQFDPPVVHEQLFRRYATFKPGDPLLQSDITRLYANLLETDYVDSATIDLLPQADGLVDVAVEVHAAKRWGLAAGAGFATDTGPVISTEVLNRRVNRRGHRLNWENTLAVTEQNSALDYRIPGKRPASDWYSFYTGYRSRHTDAVNTIGWHTGIRRGRRINSHLLQTQFVEFAQERVRENRSWRAESSVVPGFTLGYLRGGETSRPRTGLRATFELAGASSHLGSDASFLRTRLSAKTIVPVGPKLRVLLLGEVGYIITDNFSSVAPSWRFNAGGDASVRGFDYQSLGPKDAAGDAIGGSTLIVSSAELDFPIATNWSVAVFTDQGTVADGLPERLDWSYGAGVRWYSPLGPIRVSLAKPGAGGGSIRLHVSLGPDL